MKKMIKLTLIHPQEWTTFATYEIWRKPNTTGIISVDPTKIISVRSVQPDNKSYYYRRDYPIFTEITMVGRNTIDVVETPEQVEKLINS